MKSQLFSIESIINISLFLSMFSMLIFMASSLNDKLSNSTGNDKMLLLTNNIINALVLYEGYPPNWNANNLQEIGLCDSPYVINPKKLSDFIGLLNANYSYAKQLMSLSNEDFYISLEYFNGSKISELKFEKSVETLIISKRKVLYLGNSAILKVGVMI